MKRKTFVFVSLGCAIMLNAAALGFFTPAPHVRAQLMMPTATPAEVETKVREYFTATPEMITIAKCESAFRQYDATGLPLKGGGGQYIGVFQISVGHIPTATGLGWDIYTLDGNLGYAKYLYEQKGTAPWTGCAPTASAAKPISAPTEGIPPAAEPAQAAALPTLTVTLTPGILHNQVISLQKLLNAADFPVAVSGPGSPGNETTKYGTLTRLAVQKFQCSQNIACSGDEKTTGYGLVGPRTRAALLQAAAKTNP